MKFHEKLQNLRKNAGMTQLELAEKLMVSRQAISKWETGNATPDLENIIPICDLFDVSLDYLARDTHIVETEEVEQNITEKMVCQEDKKARFRKRAVNITLIIALVVILQFVGWRMNLVAITLIPVLWGVFCGVLYWGGRKILALLSKYVWKGEEIHRSLRKINES